METANDVTRMRTVGGNLTLDYLNTRSGPPVGAPDDDVLLSYDDVLAWARHVDLLADQEVTRLLRRARKDPDGAHVAYQRALAVREHLDELFRTVAAGGRPASQRLAWLRDTTAEALAHAQLAPGHDRFGWHWTADQDLARPLWPIVHAAADLLTNGPLDRIKACAGCRFLFIDESKNRSRRWCSMEDCGTAEKIRRYVSRRAATHTRTAR
ncbi:CGNR zinc finger domain-containing protein [Phytohabitans kaempferiae]|uniref:CGNR zinc finger domain-containing protein n=1 Tax=Phytohabitans kaempferiae TaxID=1620943 RepID=A0ABV6MBN9_9ACTN